MYYDFCHLKHDPFAETPDPEFLYLSSSHKAALHALISGIEARQALMAILGAPGLGKTTILRACQARIQPLCQTIFIGYPRVSFSDVLALICEECGLESATDRPAAMLNALEQTLREKHPDGWRVVLFIDEAHHIPVPTLEGFLHLLALRTATGEHPFQVVLAGFPELQRTLNLSRLRSLKQHLAVRVALLPLTSEESRAYICHRLTKVLISEDELFTPGALKRIIGYARGNPRVLNMLCSNTLITGSLYQQKPISAELVREVMADLGTKSPRLCLRWGRATAAGLLLIAGVLWGWQSQWLGSATGGPLELSQLTQRLAGILRGPSAEQPLEVPVRSLPGEPAAPPPQAIPDEQRLSPVLPPAPALPSLQAPGPEPAPAPVTTVPQERRPPRGPERDIAERATTAPVVQPRPRQVAPSLSPGNGRERAAAEVDASLTPSEPVAPSREATGQEQARPPIASAPSIRSLKALDRGLLREPESAVSVEQSPADTPRQEMAGQTTNAPPVPPRPASTPLSPVAAAVPKMKTVHFHSLPEEAMLFIDGKIVGRTPITVQLPMGSHHILIEKAAYTSISYRLNVDRDGESNLYHDLHLNDQGR